MKIPNADDAIVDAARVRDYLLSPTHPVGRAKARFFAQLGFDQQNWTALQAALYPFAQKDAQLGSHTGFGQKYVVEDTIEGPAGGTARLVVVWIILNDEDIPRFVTAYPGTKP